jgi:hypothetical protein
MKTRNGFVSNSSSSSFIVKYRDMENTCGKIHHFYLTDTELKLLKKYGFKYTTVNNPYFVGILSTALKTSTKIKDFRFYDDINLSYDVTCNQDDVIYFLLKNKIPFVALCHYEQELVVWDGKSKFFYEMPNIIEMISRENGELTFDVGEKGQYFPAQLCPKIKKYEIDEWLKKEETWISTLV